MSNHLPIAIRPIAGGLNKARNPLLLGPGESPDCLNVDFDRESVAAARGSIKFGNQVAPSSALETRVDSGFSGLAVMPGKSVPLRGYGYIPYDERQDIGAPLTYTLYDPDTVTGGITDGWYPSHNAQRGKSFELCVSFRLPKDTVLHGRKTGARYNPAASYETILGGAIALDEFTAIVQKGGDRLQPMSWALGIVNVANLPDVAAYASGDSLLGVSPSTFAARKSDYALCFMWLDAPKHGENMPVQMRYRTDNGVVYADDYSLGNDAYSNGLYPTMALRAFIAPLWVVPGEEYHVALQLQLDSGTAGGGAEPTTSWNNDGVVRVIVQQGRTTQTFEYEQATPGSATLYRYKGPGDSLEYLTKYGLRYHGRDPMYLGLGYRGAPWAAAGFIPYGIDSAPIEKGGFRLTDESLHSPSTYTESSSPATSGGVGGPGYFLRVAHSSAADATGRVIEVSDKGLVYNLAGYTSVTWGATVGQWAGISPSGRSPWGGRYWQGNARHDHEWRGLGGWDSNSPTRIGTVFHPEALRGYRLVLAPDSTSTGFSNAGVEASGGLISIGEYANGAAGTATYTQAFTHEGDISPWVGGNPTFTGNEFKAYIRAFRWNQRPVVVSDLRIYSSPRNYAQARTALSLLRFPTLEDSTKPGIADLVGAWPLDEAGSGALRDIVGGNDGVRAPYTLTQTDTGTRGEHEVFLSGDGEALKIELGDNPIVRQILADTLQNGRSGFAVEVTMRIPEAVYGIPITRATSPTAKWAAKFASPLVTWESSKEDGSRRLLHLGQDTWFTGNAAGYAPLGATVTDNPFSRPLAFDMKVSQASDDEELDFDVPGTTLPFGSLESWRYNSSTVEIDPRWKLDADWVNSTITIQIGIEPTADPETYTAYIVATPRSLTSVAPVVGTEWGLIETLTVDRRDLERSVLTIGGRWVTNAQGYLDSNARVFLDEVRVFATSAPGKLPETSGANVPNGEGKLLGGACYPARELEYDDIMRPLVGSSSAVNVTNGSPVVTIAGNGQYPTLGPEEGLEAVDRALLHIPGERSVVPRLEKIWDRYERVFFVESQSNRTLTLNAPYTGATRNGVAARVTRLLGYTAFKEDVKDRPLSIGGGGGFDPAFPSVENAVNTPGLFENVGVAGIPWGARVYSPLPAGRAQDIAPRWVRGLKAPTDQPILGLGSLNDTLYAGVRGALYEADDRWRPDGPGSAQRWSLLFRSELKNRVPFPLAGDSVQQTRTDLDLTTLLDVGGTVPEVVIDAWAKLDEFARFQTVAWYGSSAETKAQWWLRLNGGYPELALASSDVDSVSGDTPQGGYFVARARARVPAGEWFHLRVVLRCNGLPNEDVQRPRVYINGKTVAVDLQGVGSAVTGGSNDWLRLSTIYDPGAALNSFVIGAAWAREDLVASAPEDVAGPGNYSSFPVEPQELLALMHGLSGQLSSFAVTTQDAGNPVFATSVNFDAFVIDYDAVGVTRVAIFGVEEQEALGVGHKWLDTAKNTYAAIASSPFISLDHEMGFHDGLYSFANYGDATFCTNGGRPVVIRDGKARKAGLRAPTYRPDVRVSRTPLWKSVEFDFSGDPDNPPINQRDLTAVSEPDNTYTYRNPGTSYLYQASGSTGFFQWDRGEYLAVKMWVKPHSTEGRINLWSQRGSLSSGVFLEIRDGRCVFGWWDASLKKEITISTEEAVFVPGKWHYVYVRKRHPRGGVNTNSTPGTNGAGSNWQNSCFSRTQSQSGSIVDALHHDMMVVRVVPTEAQSGFSDWLGNDAKAYIAYPGGGSWGAARSSARACLSFTVDEDEDYSSWGLTVPGVDTVTLPGIIDAMALSSGTAGGLVNITGASLQRFVLDHVGMLLQFTQGALAGNVYRITQINTNLQVAVVDESGAAPNLTTAAGSVVISPGTRLLKSDNYDDSVSPDGNTTENEYAVEMFGSSLAGDPLTGISPFDGEFSSLAYVVAEGRDYLNLGNDNLGRPGIFEDVASKLTSGAISSGTESGTDPFGEAAVNYSGTPLSGLPYQGCPLQRLCVEFESAAPFWSHTAVDVRSYGTNNATITTTTPNTSGDGGVPELPPRSGFCTAEDGLYWGDNVEEVGGTRRVLVTFYDPNADVESFPNTAPIGIEGELIEVADPVVVMAGDDEPSNPARALTLVLSGLPRPVEAQSGILTRIYMSPADSLDLYLVAEVDAAFGGEIAVRLNELTLLSGTPIDLNTGAPPNCEVLGVSQSSMAYGAIEGAEDHVAHSVVFDPEAVPPTHYNPIDTGSSRSITGLAGFRGELIAFKRDAVFGGTIDGEAVFWRQITIGDGCVSHACIGTLEDRLYFITLRGPAVLLPGSAGAQVFYIGKRVQEVSRTEVDSGALDQIAGVVHWSRHQYIYTYKDRDRLLQDRRVSVEFDHPRAGEVALNEMVAGHRFSLYEGPALTALVTVAPRGGGPPLLIGGTVDGFVVWLDREDVLPHLMGHTLPGGAVAPLWGALTLTHVAGGQMTGTVDLVQEGARGAVLRWLDGSGAEQEGYIDLVWSEGGNTYVRVRTATGSAAPSAPAGTVTLGAQLHRWETALIDGQAPQLDKEAYFLDVSRRATAGTLKVDCLRNLVSTPEGTVDLDLSTAFESLEVGRFIKRARGAQFLFRTETPAVGVDFELLDLVLRVEATDNR